MLYGSVVRHDLMALRKGCGVNRCKGIFVCLSGYPAPGII